jgi:hypothetical protein
MCGQVGRPLLGGGAGGRSPGLLFWIEHNERQNLSQLAKCHFIILRTRFGDEANADFRR